MSLLEKELAASIVRYEKDISEGADSVGTIKLRPHVALLLAALEAEQALRAETSRIWAEGAAEKLVDTLEGTSEYNRGHRAAVGS